MNRFPDPRSFREGLARLFCDPDEDWDEADGESLYGIKPNADPFPAMNIVIEAIRGRGERSNV
jgi:hypothetical protein